jgi:hypothetical protein
MTWRPPLIDNVVLTEGQATKGQGHEAKDINQTAKSHNNDKFIHALADCCR